MAQQGVVVPDEGLAHVPVLGLERIAVFDGGPQARSPGLDLSAGDLGLVGSGFVAVADPCGSRSA